MTDPAQVIAALEGAHTSMRLCQGFKGSYDVLRDAAVLIREQQAWRDAIDRELNVCCATVETFGNDPKKCVDALIEWHMQVALDPAVSQDAETLRDTYKAELNAARKDAERYRFLRDTTLGPKERPHICIIAFDGLAIRLGREEADKHVDAAIDAARGKGEGE